MSDVILYVYDLSHGVARQMSPILLGKEFEAIYHTSIIAYGFEYYYGGGIACAQIGTTLAGNNPMRIIKLGNTSIKQSDFHQFLISIKNEYTMATYDLINNNCNNFANRLSIYLTNGRQIPKYILTLPQDALNTPLGSQFRPMLEQMQSMNPVQGGNETLILPSINNSNYNYTGRIDVDLSNEPIVSNNPNEAIFVTTNNNESSTLSIVSNNNNNESSTSSIVSNNNNNESSTSSTKANNDNILKMMH